MRLYSAILLVLPSAVTSEWTWLAWPETASAPPPRSPETAMQSGPFMNIESQPQFMAVSGQQQYVQQQPYLQKQQYGQQQPYVQQQHYAPQHLDEAQQHVQPEYAGQHYGAFGQAAGTLIPANKEFVSEQHQHYAVASGQQQVLVGVPPPPRSTETAVQSAPFMNIESQPQFVAVSGQQQYVQQPYQQKQEYGQQQPYVQREHYVPQQLEEEQQHVQPHFTGQQYGASSQQQAAGTFIPANTESTSVQHQHYEEASGQQQVVGAVQYAPLAAEPALAKASLDPNQFNLGVSNVCGADGCNPSGPLSPVPIPMPVPVSARIFGGAPSINSVPTFVGPFPSPVANPAPVPNPNPAPVPNPNPAPGPDDCDASGKGGKSKGYNGNNPKCGGEGKGGGKSKGGKSERSRGRTSVTYETLASDAPAAYSQTLCYVAMGTALTALFTTTLMM